VLLEYPAIDDAIIDGIVVAHLGPLAVTIEHENQLVAVGSIECVSVRTRPHAGADCVHHVLGCGELLACVLRFGEKLLDALKAGIAVTMCCADLRDHARFNALNLAALLRGVQIGRQFLID
jgi:hypothetical protein